MLDYLTFSRTLKFVLVIAVSICFVFYFVPFSPLMPEPGLDNSWRLGMNEAISSDFNIGKDIVFTFGPYASVYTKYYNPDTDFIMMWSSLYFSLSYAFAVCFVFRKHSVVQIPVFMVILIGCLSQADAVYIFYPLVVFFAFLGFNSKNLGNSQTTQTIATSIILLFPFGLLPLIKGSMAVICGGMGFILLLLFLVRKNKELLLTMIIVGFVSPALFWIAAGQNIQLLPNYLINMAPITLGYTEGMSLTGPIQEVLTFILTGATLMIIAFFSFKRPMPEKVLILIALAFFLFIILKASFVRHDTHAEHSADSLLMIGVLLFAFTDGRLKRIPISLFAIPISLFGYIFIVSGYRGVSPQSISTNFVDTFKSGYNGLNHRLLGNHHFQKQFDTRMEEFKAEGNFPLLKGTSDIYNFHQYLLIGSENKWNPRPIFQSYSAYTPKLLEMNKQHLMGEAGPDNVFFKVQSIDRRLPSLEDSTSWSVLLTQFEPAYRRGDYLILQKHRNAPNGKLNLIYSVSSKVGAKIPIPESSKLVFAKIKMEKSLTGKISGLLYKPDQVMMKVYRKNGQHIKTFRYIPEIGAAGFLLSPLVENTDDFGLLLSGPDFYQTKNIGAIEFEVQKGIGGWKDQIKVDFFSLEVPPSSKMTSLLNSISFIEDNVKIVSTHDCRLAIGRILDAPKPKDGVKFSNYFKYSGWAFFGNKEAAYVPGEKVTVLTYPTGVLATLPVESYNRPDVAKGFKNNTLITSGVSSTGIISNLPAGHYSLRIAEVKGQTLNICNAPNAIYTFEKLASK